MANVSGHVRHAVGSKERSQIKWFFDRYPKWTFNLRNVAKQRLDFMRGAQRRFEEPRSGAANEHVGPF
jgi:hypothetical protein